jgi:hypothetical protein
VRNEFGSRSHDDGLAAELFAETFERARARLEGDHSPAGAELREGDARELVRRVGEDAHANAAGFQPAKRSSRVCVRAQVDGCPVFGEPLEQDAPVSGRRVELGRRFDAVVAKRGWINP